MNPLSLLLLVDSDRKGLEALTYGFEREGCAVAGTIDATLAPELARTTTPQLAVISLHEPDPQTLSLISGLRGQPNTKDLPVVTLGPAALRPAALAAGASDFLSTPLFVRDVVSVGKLMLLMRGALAASQGEGGIELQARLSEYYGLYYLIRAMSATSRSGILQLSRGNKRGEVRFSEGTVTSAHVGSTQAVPALHQLLLWEEAALSLKLRPVVKRGQFSMAPAELLDECERFLRDFAHAARDLGSPRTIYVAVTGAPVPGAKKVPAEAMPVMRLFDGQRALAEVIEDSPFRVFDTLRVIKRLLDAGGLALKPGPVIRDGNAAGETDQWTLRPTASAPTPPRPRLARQSGAHAPTGNAGVPRLTPARLSSVPEQRGGAADRRKTTRPRELLAPMPAPVPGRTPAPIPLTVRKNAPEPVVLVNDAGSGRRPIRPPTPSALVALGTEPTIHAKLDAAFPHRSTPMVAHEPPPLTTNLASAHLAPTPMPVATPGSGPVLPVGKTPPPQSKGPDSKTKLKKSHPRLTPASTFNAIESDFFAREADLYKHDVVESFDDLDRGGTGRKMQPVRNAPGNARKKR
ncbi:MAG TPA: DUF4388 domain-containing protein [Polyangia bacterium]|jgi:CheY-like chemotaxis protein|nr:DUF4388 domain-containing protein [Polyangia bacterium]